MSTTARNGKKPIKKRIGVGRNPTLIPGNPGNRGGAKGKSGRKPDAFKAMCEAACDDVVLPKVLAYLKQKTADPTDPWWWKCAEYVTGYGKGKPAQTMTLAQDEDAPPFRFTLNLGEAALHQGDDE